MPIHTPVSEMLAKTFTNRGSVKSNIGHAEGASGLASVIKAILALEHGVIPPNANFELLNPKIAADQLKIKVCHVFSLPDESNLIIFKVVEHLTRWPTAGLRRASINSFGASGTNAHVILDDALNFLRQRNLKGNHCTIENPESPEIPSSNGIEPTQASQLNGHNGSKESVKDITFPRLLILSAFDKPALQRVLGLHSQWMQKHKSTIKAKPELLRDLAYTFLERRSLLRYRTFAVVDEDDAVQAGGHFSSPIRATNQLRIVFVFTGQGAQWAGMGRGLMQFPAFHDTIKEANAYLKEIGVGFDVIGKGGSFISI